MLFGVALIALTVLACSTAVIFILIPARSEPEPEDPFITTLRKRYQSRIEALNRLDELKDRLKTRAKYALKALQDEIQSATENESAPQMVETLYLIQRLRRMRVTDTKQIIESAVDSLVKEGSVCRESYSGPLWIIPDDNTIEKCLTKLNEELALVISEYSEPGTANTVEGYLLTSLQRRIARASRLPEFVVGEYIIPFLLQQLLDGEFFHTIKMKYPYHTTCIFVNRKRANSRVEWENLIDAAHKEYKNQRNNHEIRKRKDPFASPGFTPEKEFIRQYIQGNLLKFLPCTVDRITQSRAWLGSVPVSGDQIDAIRDTILAIEMSSL